MCFSGILGSPRVRGLCVLVLSLGCAEVAQAAGRVVITEIMYNPASKETRGETEWVEIANQSRDRVDLTEWELRDRFGRPRPLAGTLEAGAIERFAIPRDTEFGMMLANRRGVITLHDPHGRLAAAVSYGKAEEDAVIAFR